MKIKYINDDLFNTTVNCIIHGCNAQGVMGAGFAKKIKQYYPEAFKKYREYYEIYGLNVGDVIYSESNDKFIINAITQEKYGNDPQVRYVSYDAVDNIMKELDFALSNSYPKITQVAMPMIGSGLANGSWDVIESIIETRIRNIQPIVYYR
ncbi:MAG: macro domain-containing protein [archaeon]